MQHSKSEIISTTLANFMLGDCFPYLSQQLYLVLQILHINSLRPFQGIGLWRVDSELLSDISYDN